MRNILTILLEEKQRQELIKQIRRLEKSLGLKQRNLDDYSIKDLKSKLEKLKHEADVRFNS